jgi:threonine dehydratase
VALAETSSIADGLLPRAIGAVPLAVLRAHAAHFGGALTVDDDGIREAVHDLRDRCRVTAEPSGAVTTAAWRGGRLALERPVVLVVSGGNVDPAFLEAEPAYA